MTFFSVPTTYDYLYTMNGKTAIFNDTKAIFYMEWLDDQENSDYRSTITLTPEGLSPQEDSSHNYVDIWNDKLPYTISFKTKYPGTYHMSDILLGKYYPRPESPFEHGIPQKYFRKPY